jgi:predicted metalloprotease with PDZ domain
VLSAEKVSRSEYNADPTALGDYTGSPHLTGEIIATMLDFAIRDATNGTKSLDDVMRLMLERFSGRAGFTSRDVERTVGDVCKCSVHSLFDHSVYHGGEIDYAKFLRLAGLQATTVGALAADNGVVQPDLRIGGWNRDGEHELSVRLWDPSTAWGHAGLHTGDRIVSMNQSPMATRTDLRNFLRSLKIGDTVAVIVSRPAGRFSTRVPIMGYLASHVTVTPLPHATTKAVAIRERWSLGY